MLLHVLLLLATAVIAAPHPELDSLVPTATQTTAISKRADAADSITTPSSFYIQHVDGGYISLATEAGGGFYLVDRTESGAAVFKFSGTELVVVSSAYYHYIAVGTPSGAATSSDWYQMEVKPSGTDGKRPVLSCSLTSEYLLSCGNGEIFAKCEGGAVYEGPPAAATEDYYYQAMDCAAIKLMAVAT